MNKNFVQTEIKCIKTHSMTLLIFTLVTLVNIQATTKKPALNTVSMYIPVGVFWRVLHNQPLLYPMI